MLNSTTHMHEPTMSDDQDPVAAVLHELDEVLGRPDKVAAEPEPDDDELDVDYDREAYFDLPYLCAVHPGGQAIKLPMRTLLNALVPMTAGDTRRRIQEVRDLYFAGDQEEDHGDVEFVHRGGSDDFDEVARLRWRLQKSAPERSRRCAEI